MLNWLPATLIALAVVAIGTIKILILRKIMLYKIERAKNTDETSS